MQTRSGRTKKASLVAVAGILALLPSVADAMTGTVRVFNRGVEALSISINGTHRGVTPPGRTYSYFGIRPGLTSLLVTNPQGRVRFSSRFHLAPGGAKLWTVGTPTAVSYRGAARLSSVQVRHHFPVPAHIWLDRRYCGRALPGGTVFCSQVWTGARRLVAKAVFPPFDVLYRRMVSVGVERFVAMVPPPDFAPPGAMAHAAHLPPVPMAPPVLAPAAMGVMPLPVAPVPGTLRVINRGAEQLNLIVGGVPQGTIVPGAVRDLGVMPGSVRVLATNASGHVRADASLLIQPGQISVWQLVYDSGTYRYAMAR